MLGRIATYVVPTLAVAVTAAVLLGPGATRKAAFVRVYGTPRAGMTRLALRIEGAERLYGTDTLAPLENLWVQARDGDVTLTPGFDSLGPDGIGEVLLLSSRPLVGPVELSVTQGKTSLAHGFVPLTNEPPGKPRILSPFEIPGHSTGGYRITVMVPRGALVASQDNTLEVQVALAEHVSPSLNALDGLHIFASAPGATLKEEELVTDANGATTLVIRPHMHQVDLSLTIGKTSSSDQWEGTLPIVPGATWLRPDFVGNFVFESPTPRQLLYVSFARDTGRLFGSILGTGEPGLFVLPHSTVPDDILRATTQLIVSGDPQEQGSGTIAWPLEPSQMVVAAPTIELMLDGAKAAEDRERGRASRVRRLALLVVIATTIFEVLFMIAKSRQSQKRFEEGLMRFAEEEPSSEGAEPLPLEKRPEVLASARQENPALRVALAISLVLVAFSMIGALSTLQW